MRLIGKVETAKISDFGDVELSVVDKEVKNPSGTGRPQYTCKIARGLPGLDELRQMRKEKVTAQEMVDYALQNVPLPQEDEVIELTVLGLRGKDVFQTLVCEISVVS